MKKLLNPPAPRKTQCATCPFRKQGWTEVQPLLVQRATSEASPICHSTGPDRLKGSCKKPFICRGARDLQLKLFVTLGYLKEPTDEAWAAKLEEINNKRGKQNATLATHS